MNISNVSSASNIYPPASASAAKPASVGDHDGDADDRAGAVASAQSEATEGGRLNVTA
jgi:hypothetical protein